MANPQGDLLEGVLVNFPHLHPECSGVLHEERVGSKNRSVDLLLQFGLQRPWQQLQDDNIALVDTTLGAAHSFLETAPHATHEVARDSILTEISPQNRHLVISLSVQISELCHCVRDGGDEGGECYHGKQDNKDCEAALHLVLRSDLHGCRRELCKTPMQGCNIPVRKIHSALENNVLCHPRILPLVRINQGTQAIPSASNNMIDHADEDKQLEDSHHNEAPLRLDAINHLAQYSTGLEEPQQSHKSKELHRLAKPKEAKILTAVASTATLRDRTEREERPIN
mmetsp:Transcript_103955/g.260689  ORF Transcript_103955/g.260689 Transcript_103955/m.260689 type:complete len:283 (+) Transcript_103955:91-939(+)